MLHNHIAMSFTPIPVKTLSNGCKFDMSSHNQLQRELETATLAIKFVLEGQAIYHFNGKNHKVRSQQFIILNHRRCMATIDGQSPLNGFCISIPYPLLDEILNAMETINISKHHFIDYLDNSNFFEHVNNANSSRLGVHLQSLASTLQNSHIEHSQLYLEEQFMRVAELAVASQLKTFEEFSALNTSKQTIQKDLYRKLLNARDFLAANFAYDVKMQEAAEAANISEYYFYRLFKAVFKCTPYQYLQERRLDMAKDLLKKGMPISHVAYEAGFADAQSFNKAFKKQEGVPPSLYWNKTGKR